MCRDMEWRAMSVRDGWAGAPHKMRLDARGRWSEVGGRCRGRLLVVGCWWSVVGGRWSVIGVSGWSVVERSVVVGRWSVFAGRRWRVVGGGWLVVGGR